MRKFIGKLGHRIADFDPQTGITGWIMRLCWKFGYPDSHDVDPKSNFDLMALEGLAPNGNQVLTITHREHGDLVDVILQKSLPPLREDTGSTYLYVRDISGVEKDPIRFEMVIPKGYYH